MAVLISLGALLLHLEGSSHHLARMDLRPASFFLHVPTHAAIALLNTITWMVGVGYGVFHVGLNLLAELTGFGDRRFYGRWWELLRSREGGMAHRQSTLQTFQNFPKVAASHQRP